MNPADLIGVWSVEREVHLALLVDGQLAIWRGRRPGLQYGEWRAAPSGLLIATVSSWSGGLEEGGTPPPWLSAATAIAIAEHGRGAQLMGSHGQFLAELVRVYDAALPSGVRADDLVVTAQLRADLARQPALPAGLTVATPERLVGRWVPTDGVGSGAPTQPFAELRTDGTWTGTDGCNRENGRWAVDHGALIATQGLVTLVACNDMFSVGGLIVDAAVCGFDGHLLVLIDSNGLEIGRLAPE